jgi:mannose-1-phosphate guanylyltransferase
LTSLPYSTDKLKAVLLAGGYGTRAKPFTDYFPKAMFPLDGRPVIDHIVRFLARFSSISEIVIVCDLDRFGKQIINYFEGKDSVLGRSIRFVKDEKRGTGGSLLGVERYIGQDEYFLVWFADNLSGLKINHMIREYNLISSKNKEAIIGMIAIRKKRREETGRVILENPHVNSGICDTAIRIKEFMEKHSLRLEQPEALGIYIFSKRIFEYLHKRSNEGYSSFNLSHDILEKIPGNANMFAYDIGDDVEWLDAQSLPYLDRNRDIVEKILFQMHSVSPDSASASEVHT